MFQSTRPARGATGLHRHSTHLPDVSIHAPRAGRDRHDVDRIPDDFEFQSTRPARGATVLPVTYSI